jgi:tRNA-Thr(GGU) m(6)t(6)A37 methyltransferase TsaA
MPIQFEPVGLIHTPYKDKSGMPIQSSLTQNSKGTVEVFNDYAKGLMDIDGFSHLILIYHLHLVNEAKLVCQPFLENKPHGIFAVRSPARPNPIGLSIVRLIKRDGNILHIEDVDILDQTPLLDIKPYVPKFDIRKNAKAGWFDKALKGVENRLSDDRFGK